MIFAWGAALLPACTLVLPGSDLIGPPLAGSDATDAVCRASKAPTTPCTSGGASSCVTTIVAAPPTLPDGGPTIDTFTFGIAVDETYVFWSTQADENGHSAGVIHRASKDGKGAPTTLTAPDGPYPAGTALALDSTFVYWLGPSAADAGTIDVARIRKDSPGCDGGCMPPTLVGTAQPQGDLAQSQVAILPGGEVLAISANTLFSPTSASAAAGPFPSMALWHRSVLWIWSDTVRDSKPLYIAPVDDLSHPSALANPPAGGAKYITSDCVHVFASIFDPDYGVTVLDPAMPGGGWQTLLAGTPKQKPVYSFVADEAFVYVGYAGHAGLDRVDIAARKLERNFYGYSVWGIALDDEAIYFGDHGEEGRLSGAILRITK